MPVFEGIRRVPDSSLLTLAVILVSFAGLICVGTVAAVLIGAFRR